MARALRAAIVGWSTGFLIAVAWSGSRAHDPRMTSTLIPWAGGGLLVMALLLVVVGVREVLARRRLGRTQQADRADAEWFAQMRAPALPERQGSDAVEPLQARVAAATADAAAARIAILEARLALEQEHVEATLRVLAREELLEAAMHRPGLVPADAEPLLRAELTDALAELLGSTGQVGEVSRHLETRLERAG